MGWRFRKRIRIVKGLWINLSKRGGSLSVGGHGLTANISKKGVRETVGLPGSGISYSNASSRDKPRPQASKSAAEGRVTGPLLSAHRYHRYHPVDSGAPALKRPLVTRVPRLLGVG